INERISSVKKRLGEKLLILGHHYQRDSIIQHTDLIGDSFLLSRMAADSDSEFIVFCGVHFMAESADILTNNNQKVILPNLRAGCSMADMANLKDVTECWNSLIEKFDLLDPIHRENPNLPAPENENYLIPITYMNSSASLKAFVGSHGGVVCTSSNAEGVLNWAFERAGKNGKILFFPDQHLGRNTGLAMGLSHEEMATWTPNDKPEWDLLEQSKIILWHGYCSVHRRFSTTQISEFREKFPEGLVVVHPECKTDVVNAADSTGSTEFIRNFVKNAPDGAIIGVGTEINMVQRLNEEYENKDVSCLDPSICPCSTMYMIHPIYLLDVLERIESGEIPNQIIVPEDEKKSASIALNRMLSILK
ncbi:MAG: quinolinate synthase NadA, partial [Candidatus Thermoplasmatota archaeon]|nr:quinolinate synthase NadA [Candidatus Thermoplasmatota archaeon]